MTLIVSEKEMIERYVDGLKEAKSRADQITKVEDKEKPEVFVQFINALKVSAGSAHQLAHQQRNPKFLSIRDQLESVIEVAQKVTAFSGSDNQYWNIITEALDNMAKVGYTFATSKPMKAAEVYDILAAREKLARVEVPVG